uniref:hypothetical protein n=1 Tax=Pseudomonas laurentiana TaxID=2364649 RepID=UPI0029C63EC8|nr:hypothetical protein [Pseudomonas laurentiana]
MLTFKYDKSFVAFVECTTPGFEGYLDCGELKMKPLADDPHGREAPHRRAADWLTVTSYKGREAHRFWFRCFEDSSTGKRYFDIQSWSRRTGRDLKTKQRHCDLSSNGYVGLHEAETPHECLWQVSVFDQDTYCDVGDDLALGKIESVVISSYKDTLLCAYGREQVGNEWYCYAADSNGPALILTLDIQDLGEELLENQG